MTSVTINGQYFSVKGVSSRAQFMVALHQCRASTAAVASFEDWRAMRRATNITAGVGLCLFFPVILATPVTAVMAGDRRADFLVAMQTD